MVDGITTKIVKNKTDRDLTRIANFTVSYSPAGDKATVVFKDKETFPPEERSPY